jgi:hypothetical protein
MVNGVGLTEPGGEALFVRVVGTEGNLPEEGVGGGFGAGEAAEAQSVFCRFQQPVNLAARYGQELGLDFRGDVEVRVPARGENVYMFPDNL